APRDHTAPALAQEFGRPLAIGLGEWVHVDHARVVTHLGRIPQLRLSENPDEPAPERPIDSNAGNRRGGEIVAIRVGINGFGRIGRNFFRAHLQRGGDFEIVAANDLGDVETMAYLLKHDSVLGTLDEEVAAGDGAIRVGAQELKLLSERDPADLPWG